MYSKIKKRGQYHPADILLIPAISLALVFGFVFLPILADITGIQETYYFEKMFLVRDMATIINALYASPGNIVVPYNKETFWFTYEFDKYLVAVFDETSILKTKTKYQILADRIDFKNITLNAKFKEDEKSKDNLKEKVTPIFAKIGNDIVVDNKLGKNINELKCINLEPIKELQNKISVIDAGHGGEDDGTIANNFKEKDLAEIIGFSLYELLDNQKFFTREEVNNIKVSNFMSRRDILKNKENLNLILSIHIGDYNSQNNNIKAYYSIESTKEIQQKSMKIACTILNELLKEKELEIDGISVIGIYPEDYNGGDVLVKDKIAVLFEIGNIQNKKSVEILTNPSNIQIVSDSMIRGLKNVK